MMSLLLVFLGGGLGSLCRFGISKIFTTISFPYGTLTANIISCFLLGILIGLNMEGLMKSEQKLLLMTGFCGGFSTFSTFSGEIVQLYQDGASGSAIAYVTLSLVSGVACILIGIWMSRSFIS